MKWLSDTSRRRVVSKGRHGSIMILYVGDVLKEG